MLLSSFPLTLVVEADGTDSGAASTGKKFKSLFTMNTVQNIYKVTMQGGQGSRDGLVGKVLCIYIYTHRCRERGKKGFHMLSSSATHARTAPHATPLQQTNTPNGFRDRSRKSTHKERTGPNKLK